MTIAITYEWPHIENKVEISESSEIPISEILTAKIPWIKNDDEIEEAIDNDSNNGDDVCDVFTYIYYPQLLNFDATAICMKKFTYIYRDNLV